jgi:teichuronic acid biosynthesis glycosyltransferase TuaC
MNILTLTTLYPSSVQPLNAIFVRNRMEAVVSRYGHQWTVVAPVPYFPKLPFNTRPTYDAYARVPLFEKPWGYSVHHPRYLVTPKFGMRYYGSWMTMGVKKLIRRLHAQTPFDVIDGHYVYPDGTAAVRLGRELNIPVILSARGTDLNLYPHLPGIAQRIRANLSDCRHLICVCGELKQEAIKLGMAEANISVIGNGVDIERFRRVDRTVARAALGLPLEGHIILSVGHMTERKGFHLLLRAFAEMGRRDATLVIAGDGPQRAELEALRRESGLGERIKFPGAVRNEDLPAWYSAASLFVLCSSREGWPNVLCEAQAVGLPVVATRVWGIPEIVTDATMGILVEERSVQSLRAGISEALDRSWDNADIEQRGRQRTWANVAAEVERVVERVAGRT